jgi:hypothetical protein
MVMAATPSPLSVLALAALRAVKRRGFADDDFCGFLACNT